MARAAFLLKPLPGDGATFLPRPVTNHDVTRTQEYLGLDQNAASLLPASACG